jgi:hypothetical protein
MIEANKSFEETFENLPGFALWTGKKIPLPLYERKGGIYTQRR